MGGIVARRYLVQQENYDLKEKGVKEVGLFLVASPSLGAEYANLFKEFAKILNHSQADALRFSQNNTWLNALDQDFLRLNGRSASLTIRGKELVETQFRLLGVRLPMRQVVEPFSGARYFTDPYTVPNSDHFTIAKPESREAIQHRLLCRFIRENFPSAIIPVPSSPPGSQAEPDNRNLLINVPTPNYLDLLGRQNELDKIKDALGDPRGRRIVGISGLGGTGKTAVAIEVARALQELGFQNIVWQTASSASAKSLQESRMTFKKG
jgi:hypothetical protein